MKYSIAILFIVFSSLLSTQLALSQRVVHTKAAQTNIKIRHHGHVSEFWSDRLDILLNYSDASFSANLQKQNIHSDDILLEEELGDLTENLFELSGKLGMEYIETSNHSPFQFEFKGTLSFTGNKLPVSGLGRLEHIDGGYVACLLSFKFILDNAILPEEILKRHAVEDISVEVLQSILKPEEF